MQRRDHPCRLRRHERSRSAGLAIDANPIKARSNSGGAGSLERAYRSGMINETNNMGSVAIIDCRGPNPGLFHDAYRAFAVRARLQRENGTHANQLIWEGPEPLDCRHAMRAEQLQARWIAG